MKRRTSLVSFLSFCSSIRVRLTLWYLAIIASMMILFGGSLYATQTFLNTATANSRLETQLYEDAQQLNVAYQKSLARNDLSQFRQEKISSHEVLLLLGPDKTVLDTRGGLPDTIVRQLQSRAENSQPLIDLNIPDTNPNGWRGKDRNYRVLIMSIIDKNARVAILIVGLQKEFVPSLLFIWLFDGIVGLLVAALGGYWLAGKTLQPVKMITQAANDIHATDLRRRLNLKRRDEFGNLAATFDQMLSRLDAAFKRQTQFTADASHELRTPLTIIDLEINRALTQLSLSEEYRQVLELVQTENTRMSSIVNNLLLLARADSGQIILHTQTVDLSDIALASIERLLPLAQKNKIVLATGNLPELLIQGDQHYLEQVMVNIVENAIKYTSGIGQRVFVELVEECGWGVIRVQDDGPGIAEEHLPYLFDRFYRVDRARSHNEQQDGYSDLEKDDEVGGTGLGLSLVQWIVLAHGGKVFVESEADKGSVFEVRFPLLKQTGK